MRYDFILHFEWYQGGDSFEQLITYPALGLCAMDEAHKLVERGDNTVRS